MTIENLVIVDVETTGLDPKSCAAIEVAAAWYNVKTATVIESLSFLMHSETNEAFDINRISPDALRMACTSEMAWDYVSGIARRASLTGKAAYVAHRAEFDESFFAEDVAARMPWVCSKFDIEWPLSKPGASLVEVALAHGVPVHDNHRALTDVLLLAKTFQAVHRICDVQAMLAKAMRPKVEVVSLAPFEEKEIVKQHGFQWDPTRREWRRRIVQDEIAALPFKVRRAS